MRKIFVTVVINMVTQILIVGALMIQVLLMMIGAMFATKEDITKEIVGIVDQV